MNSGRAKRIVMRIISALMLICALPMCLLCFSLMFTAQTNYHDGVASPEPVNAAFGGLAMAVVYVFTLVTAISGLVFAAKPHRYGWCRTMAYLQLGAGLLLIFPLEYYAVIALPPLLVLTVPLLCCTGWRKKLKEEA